MTEQEIEEYLRSLDPESFELTVRISWFPERVSPAKDRPRDPYPVTARFDQAVDPETGKVIGTGEHNYLKWFVRPGFLKDPYGYRMEKGKAYRLKVRAKRRFNGDKEYYVDALLEKNVDEPKLDVLAQFYSEYDTEVKECIFLNRKQLYGWGMYWDYPRYALSSVAMIMDPEHGAVEYRPAALYYLDARKKNRAKLSFEPLHAYRASVRKSLFKDDRYLLVTMPQEVTEPRFEEVIADYLKPRTIQNEFGTFTLDRDYDWFSGETEILGRTCQITLDTGPGGTDASAAEAVLKEILKDPEALIKGAKNFAADDMYDSLEDWYDEPLTREEFMERIGMPDIAISNDGSVSLFFDGTELFAGHTVIVDMNRDGTFDDAYLAG